MTRNDLMLSRYIVTLNDTFTASSHVLQYVTSRVTGQQIIHQFLRYLCYPLPRKVNGRFGTIPTD